MDEEIVSKPSRRERFVSIDGIRTHITETGDGQPLLLIHGLGGPLMWQHVIKPLSEHFRVLVIDLPGWGDSDCPPQPYSTEMYADFVVHCLDTLSIHRAIVAGISYGGQIAAIVSYRHPARAEKLIMITSTGLKYIPLFKNELVWRCFSFCVNAIVLHSEWLMCFLARRSFYDISKRPHDLCAKFYRQLSQHGKREAWLNAFRNIYTEKLDNHLTTITIPTLILWGKNDKTVMPHVAEELHQRIQSSRIKLFQQCAHSIPLEKPQELCDTIISFVQQHNMENIVSA